MFPVTTVYAVKDLSLAGKSVHTSASRARLAGVGGIDFRQLTPLPGEFVPQELGQEAPALVEDALGEPSVGLHHIADLELLDHDGAVALGVVVAELMAEVLSLSPHTSVKVSNANLRFLSVLRSFLSSRNTLLSASKTLEGFAIEAGRLDQLPVRIRDHVRDASVDGHDRFSLRLRGFDFDQTDDRDKPLIPVPLESTGLGRTFERTVGNSSKVSQLGKPDDVSVKSPSLRVRLAESDEISASLLPTRALTELFEAALPSLVQLDEELRANVAGNVCKPRKLFPKVSQFVDLIESRGKDALVARARQTKKPLLVCEVPQEPQGGLPLTEPLDLRGYRVDPIAERLACDHERHYAVGLRCRQGTFARVDTSSTTSTLTWSSSQSIRGRSSRLGFSRSCGRAGGGYVATSRARWSSRTSSPTTFTFWSSTLRRLLSQFSSTRSRACPLGGSGRRTSQRFSGCSGDPTFGAQATARSLAEEPRLKLSSVTSKSRRETAVRTLVAFPTRSLSLCWSSPTLMGAVPPRPEGRGFPANIR